MNIIIRCLTTILLTIIFCDLKSEEIKLINGTDASLFSAVYYVKNDVAMRQGDIVVIATQQELSLQKPDRKLFADRDVIVSFTASDLSPILNKADYQRLSKINVGTISGMFKGNEILVYRDEGRLVLKKSGGFSDLFVQTKNNVVAGLVTPIRFFIKRDQMAIRQNRYRNQAGIVRLGKNLSDKELAYLANRDQHVKTSLARYLSINESVLQGKPPLKIGMVCSGGGFRAMVSTLGFLSGATQIGLMDITTYIAALSGSTWAVGSWISYNQPLEVVRQRLMENIQKNISEFTQDEIKLAIDSILVRFAYDQPFTLVDIFGLALGNRLFAQFGNQRHTISLIDQYAVVADGHMPFPLYATVEGRAAALLPNVWAEQDGGVSAHKPWFELNPVEVGTTAYQNGMYVGAEFFGRDWLNGTTINDAPGIAMEKVLADCGSAFAVAQKELLDKLEKAIDNEMIRTYFRGFLHVTGIREKYGEQSLMFTLGEEENPFYKMPGSSLENEKFLKLKDAGLGHSNLPFALLSGDRPGRAMDILFFFDSSASLGKGDPKEFEKVEKYARLYGLKYPAIDYTNITKKTISIFKSDDPTVPVVVYMPLCNDSALVHSLIQQPQFSAFSGLPLFDPAKCIAQEFCSTFNFVYKLSESKMLTQLTEFNVRANESIIKDVIKDVVRRKFGIAL